MENQYGSQVTCGSSCAIKNKNKNFIGNDYKSFWSFHSEPINILLKLETQQLNKESFQNENLLDEIIDSKKMKSYFMLDRYITFFNHGAVGCAFKPAFEYAQQLRINIELNPVKYFDKDLFPLLAKSIV